MYESFFNLNEKPFTLNPDPDFLYLGKNHARALSILEYGIMSEAGIVVITGEIGSGKTTLIRHLLNQLDDRYTIGLITNTHKSFGELINWVSMAFGLPHEGKDKVSLYNQFLEFMINEYAEGKRVVIIVDEAQNMERDTLEELRVISNINADKDLVMQLILSGQPEFRDMLQHPGLEQFVQRVAAYYHLAPLDEESVGAYVRHRFAKAGGDEQVFDDSSVHMIHRYSGGVPRMINTLANLALTYAFAEQSKQVNAQVMIDVIKDRDTHGMFGGALTPDRNKQVVDDREVRADAGGAPDLRAVPDPDPPRANSVERIVELTSNPSKK